MEITTVSKQPAMIYATAVVVGKSAEGVTYQSIMVSHTAEPGNSLFSIFLDPMDQKMLDKLGLAKEDLKYPEKSDERIVMVLNDAKELYKGFIGTATHAPYGVKNKRTGKDRVVRSTRFVTGRDDTKEQAAFAAVQRAFENAEWYYDSPEFLDDYRNFVLFRIEADDLKAMLRGVDAEE